MTALEPKSPKPQIAIATACSSSGKRFQALIILILPILGTLAAIASLGTPWSPGWIEIGLLLSLFSLSTLGIEAGFHRYFSHNAFQAHPALRAFLAIAGSTAGQGPPIYWAANHRRHHQYSDLPGDPHSPNLYLPGGRNRLKGLWHAHLGWIIDLELTNTVLFGKDLLRDSSLSKINRLYWFWLLLSVIVPAVIDGVLTHTWMAVALGFLWGGVVRICLVQHLIYAVNSICHVFGDRPFQSNDRATNNFWLAIPTFGASWHNNHHAFPNSAIIGFSWWQIDLSGIFISFLEKVGLVWDVKKITPKMLASRAISSHREPE
jgi:stearoyl-CoA desaturase (delta-9 desaturase)